ncbi:MAG: type II toxin-antitoxin system RelE/ParE family toxin [Chitinophagaceae bacterium]
MEQAHYEIVWTKRAQLQMRQAYDYIAMDSIQNAEKVLNDIIDAMGKAIENPKIYASDEYKSGNDGSYRAFEKHRYRISYRFDKTTIRVLRVLHTKRETKLY